MAAVGSRDGREVVRTLGGLRDKVALDRDGEGRYFIKSRARRAANSRAGREIRT